MAEASNGSPDKAQMEVKDSPNGAAGPSSTDVSLTEDISIHLSPRDSIKASPRTPRATKPAGKVLSGGRGKTQPAKLPVIKATSTPRTARTDRSKEKAPVSVKTKSDDAQPKDKCEMCDEYKVMRARCLTCQANMCSSCIDHHRKMKISRDHEFQNWDKYVLEIAPTPPPPVPMSKTMCKVHRDEKLQFYCKICLVPLCTNCKLTKHEGHKTRDLNDEIAEQRENLPYKLSQIRASYLPILKQQVKELDDYGKQVSFNVKGTVENIEQRSRVMKDEIDRTSNRLVEKLKRKEKTETTKFEDRKQKLSTYIRSATTALTSGERIIQYGNDFEVMELYQNLLALSKQIHELTKRRVPRTRFMFSDGQMSSAQLQSFFGNFAEKGPKVEKAMSPKSSRTRSTRAIPALQMVPEVHARLLKTFTCKMVPGNKVSSIAPVSDTEAWICFGWTTDRKSVV